jgi:hypothetical protein
MEIFGWEGGGGEEGGGRGGKGGGEWTSRATTLVLHLAAKRVPEGSWPFCESVSERR